MKAKTRVLAMLLTVLMVVGILPLSLFATGEPVAQEVTEGSENGRIKDRTLDDIKQSLLSRT